MPDRFDLTGRRAVVTGGSRGIGFAIVSALLDAGAEVVTLSRSSADLDHPRCSHMAVDVTDDDAVTSSIQACAPIDICVVNAGGGLVEEFADTPVADWRGLIETNLVSAIVTARAALDAIDGRDRGGRLLFVGSTAGLRGEPDIPVYSATKAALSALAQALAVRHARQGITVNVLAPGEIDTELHRAALETLAPRRGTTVEELRTELVAEAIPVGRLGRPEDVAAVALFLLSDAAEFMTGQTIVIDGGQLLV